MISHCATVEGGATKLLSARVINIYISYIGIGTHSETLI